MTTYHYKTLCLRLLIIAVSISLLFNVPCVMAAKEKTSATQTAVKKKIQTTAVKPAAAKGTKKKKVQKAPVKKAAVKDSGVTKASAAPEKPVQPKDAADSKAANTAPEKTAAAKDAGEKKIHITADKMIAEGNSNNAEFIGNVKVTQEKTVITADSIKVFYNKDSESKEKAKTEDSIREIIATGNVKIWFDDKIAESSKAVYTADTKILVLTGPASRIISGNNSISGTKITFFRNDGRINVEGGGSKRVEAFFDSEGKTL